MALTWTGAQAAPDGVDQRVSALAAEGAAEVIQVQAPHHGSAELTLLQPINLQQPRCSFSLTVHSLTARCVFTAYF